jgi:general secretion pathway protein D
MTGWHVFRRESYQSRSRVLLVALVVCGGPLFALDANPPSSTTRHEVIPLTNISPERGREFLGRLKIGTASRLPGSKALLVTAEPSELQKAVAILNLVDTRTEYDIKELGPASAIPVPSSSQIASVVGGVSIGTFANPPRDKTKMRAIVDVHNGTIVAIAPVFQLPQIKLAVELGPEALKQPKALAKPTTNNLVPAGQTIQATAMPDSSEEVSTEVRASSQASDFEQPKELTLPKETPQNLLGTRERAAELQMERPSLSQSNAKPEQAAPTDQPPKVTKLTEGQSNAPTAAPSQPAKPQQAGESRQEGAAPAKPTEPAAAESTSLRPEQDVPSSPTPVTQSQAQPQPQTAPVAATNAAPPAPAPVPAAQPTELSNEEETKELTLPPKLPIIDLLDLVGKYLNLSYVYNPEELKGEVTLKLNGKLNGSIKVKDLYPLLEQTLKAANLVATRHKGNIVTIVPATRFYDIDPVLMDPSVPRVEAGDTVITCKFGLKYIDTAAAKNLLDSMKLGLDVTGIPEKRILIVTAYACRMDRIQRLLDIVDQPGEPRKFRFRQLRYTMAKTLTEKVKAMAEQMLESVTVTVAEPDLSVQVARTPGESDIAYRTRLATVRAQQTVQQAALRAQQQAVRAQAGQQEAKAGVFLDADERTNRVLMIGVAKQLGVVEQLVEALDVQQQDLRDLKLYPMHHVDADDVARKLQELGVISKLPDAAATTRYPTTTSRITPQLPGQPRLPTLPTPEAQVPPNTEVTEKGLVEEPQVVVVEATNSLLVNATVEQHAKIAHIIEYVDSETLTNEIPYKIYPLENSSPKHLSEVLQSLLQETVEQQKEGGKIEKVVVNKDEKIKIVPDPNTYSLIVYANKKNQEWIANLITQLDKRRPQVLIDVTLVEIANSDKFDYSLNLVRSSPDLTSTSGITNVTPTDKSLGRAIQTSDTGGLTAFYGDKQVQALLNTVQEKTYGRVLAKPKLLVNDNEKGTIETKDTTYVEVTSTMPVASGVPGTAAGVVQSSTNFNSYDAGITLDITPHISEGDLLRLDIKLTRSDFGTILATRPPDKKSSDVKTAVTLPNGSTVILGGMLKMRQSKGGSKVPLLGDIPLVGGLFRSVHNSEDGTKLYMFVKAEIIRPGETASHGMKDLEVLSERNRQAFEKHELEFQTYQDWPGIKSKRIDPPKVLDAQ